MDYAINATLSVTANDSTVGLSAPTATTTAAGTDFIAATQEIDTSAEQIELGDLASAAYLMIRNLDATNYVEIDNVNTIDNFPQKLLPGTFVILRPQGVTLYAKANTAAVQIQLLAVEL
jgi:hypothetical protein